MISQTSEYALRAIVFLAQQPNDSRTVMQISKETYVPAGYLAKVMQSLCRAGLVHSQRGVGGGFSLAREPEQISVLDVINVVDPIRRYPECPLGIVSHGKRLCPMHRRLDEAAQMVEKAFEETLISDLLDARRTRQPECRFPAATLETTGGASASAPTGNR